MSWKDELRDASFRDVPFQVESDELGGGRRTIVHEYPQRDKPYVEDNGRAAREISLQAFVIGPDYMAARDQLLAALEEFGPGTLVHPYYGTLTVNVKDFRVGQSTRDGGMAHFSISFHESGDLEFPTGESSTAAEVRDTTDVAEEAATEDFASDFDVAEMPDFVSADALTQLGDGLDSFSTELLPFSATASQALSDMADVSTLTGLMEDPQSLAGSLFEGVGSMFPDLGALGGAGRDLLSIARTVLSLVARFKDPALLPVGIYISAGRQQAYDNAIVTNKLFRQAALFAAADIVSLSNLPVYDDAVALRDDLSAALDAEASVASDACFAPLTDVRVQVRKDIAERSRNSARLETITPVEVLPAVAIAYDLYEDSSRDAEIVTRNGIVHPGFIPRRALKVLSV